MPGLPAAPSLGPATDAALWREADQPDSYIMYEHFGPIRAMEHREIDCVYVGSYMISKQVHPQDKQHHSEPLSGRPPPSGVPSMAAVEQAARAAGAVPLVAAPHAAMPASRHSVGGGGACPLSLSYPGK